MLGFGSMDLGQWFGMRTLGWGAGLGQDACRAGLQFDAQRATLVRVRSDSGTMPQVEFFQRVTVDPSRRADLLRRWLHTGRLRDTQAVIVLSPGDYDVYQIPAPAVPDEEMRDALRWQLRGTLPYPPEEAAIDFVRIPQPADGPPRTHLLVVAAPKATIKETVAPCLEVGVPVEAVDIPEFAQRNLGILHAGLAELPQGGGVGCGACLSFEQNTCLLTVQIGEELCFTRRLQVAGLTVESDVETDHSVSYLVERVVLQVQRSLDLYERQSGQVPVSWLVIAPHRHATRFAAELGERSGLAVSVLEPRRLLQDPAQMLPVPEAWTQDLLTALGGSLRRGGSRTAGATSFQPLTGLVQQWWTRRLGPVSRLMRRTA